MAGNKELNIIVKAKDEASSQLEKIGNSIKANFAKVSTAMTIAGGAVTAFMGSTISGAMEAEAASTQLAHAVLQVSHATQAQLDATSALADELERKGVLDGDAIKMGLAQLSTFGLSNQAVQNLGKSMADLAVNQYGVNASADDLASTANTMAKALNGQFGVLEKSGIRFTDAQQKMIQFGTETEKVTALQEGLAQNLKYTSDVALTTMEGQMAKLKVQMDNVSEAIGTALFPILQQMGSYVNDVVVKMQAWIQANPELFQQIVQVVAIGGLLLTALGTLGLILPSIITGVTMLGGALMFLAANPIGLIITAIVAFAGYLVYLYNTNEEFRVKVLEVWNVISGFISSTISFVGSTITAIITDLRSKWDTDWGGIQSTFTDVWTFLSTTGVEFVVTLVQKIQEGFAPIVVFFQENWDQISAIWNIALAGLQLAWDTFWATVKLTFTIAWDLIKGSIKIGLALMKGDWSGAWEAMKETFNNVWNAMKQFGQDSINNITKFLTEGWKQIQQGFTDFASTVKGIWDGFWNGLISTVETAKGIIMGIINAITGAINSAISALQSLMSMGGGGGGGAKSGKRARGGSVDSSGVYTVGEEGPEIFMPDQRGTIIPTSKSGGGGSSINIFVTGNTVLSEDGAEQIGDMIFNRLKLQTRI